jgi:hypothetical protein
LPQKGEHYQNTIRELIGHLYETGSSIHAAVKQMNAASGLRIPLTNIETSTHRTCEEKNKKTLLALDLDTLV